MTSDLSRLSAALADRYQVERELGAGGMATVYLAHDVRHDRRVALKVLRPELAAVIGAERFLAEIKTTANLQHPHILALFDSGTLDGTVFYVMPYVEGESLRDRLSREKQLAVTDAVRIAREVADALDYAHGQGIIHRDIKPENILLHGGHALVADFGIALAASRSEGSVRMTETGMSLGTPHYMSPEQAMGERTLDARTDVYALGCVLYEMLTGEPPFSGPTAQAIVAKVMSSEPEPVTTLRKTVPPHVTAAVHTAIQKLPADRFPTAATLASALADPSYGAATAASRAAGPTRRPLSRVLMLAPWFLTVGAAVVAAWSLRRPVEKPVTRVMVAFTPGEEPGYGGGITPGRFALTPDGSGVVYVALPSENTYELAYRRLDQLESRSLPGTEDAGYPEVSPDGERVAFVTDEAIPKLKVAALSGGPPVVVADTGVNSGPAWGPDDKLYFVGRSGLDILRVPTGGGPVELVVAVASPAVAAGTLMSLQLLPGGKRLLATFVPRDGRPENYAVYAVDLSSGAARLLVGGALQGRYAPTGHLLYVTQWDLTNNSATLMAVPFDPGTLNLGSRPVPLIEGIDTRTSGAADFAVSEEGTLWYALTGRWATEDLVWMSRTGETVKVDSAWTGYHEFEGVTLSPDGRYAAVEVNAGERADIWIKQLDQGPLSRLTFDGASNRDPAWSSDGLWVSYRSFQDSGRTTWRRRFDGSGPPELLLASSLGKIGWSSDGRWLLGTVFEPGGTDIFAMEVGVDSQPRPIIAGRPNETQPALSPDARWLAYASDESGRSEVYVQPFPDVRGGRWQMSTGGGTEPLWSADGRELFFRSVDGQTIAVMDMTAGPSVARRSSSIALADTAAGRLETNPDERLYEVTPDGRRFLAILQQGRGDATGDVVLVRNWFEELKAKARK